MRRPVTRAAVAVLFAALLVAGSVLPAAADGPTRILWPRPMLAFWYFPDSCAEFEFGANVEAQNVVEKVWTESDGTVIWQVNGVFRGSWVNLDTGYTISNREGSGMIRQTFYPDGSIVMQFTGRTGPPGAAPDYFLFGLERVWVTPDGQVTWVFKGRADYICDLLNH